MKQNDSDGSRIRNFSTPFTSDQLRSYQQGVMSYEYRGVICRKSPIDIAIYLRLLYDQKPGAIIEIGSAYGGSALLLRDISRMIGMNCEIVSIDLHPPELDQHADGITYLAGDANNLEAIFTSKFLAQLPRPWLVIEDSAHTFSTCTAVLDFCAQELLSGEYLIMEDGVLDELGLSEQYDGGPNKAIREYLTKCPGLFEIDTFYCDMFGQNATYNPNGYLRKI